MMQKIEYTQFGPATRFDAVHIIDDNGRIVAYVAEPEARNICSIGNGEWYPADGWDEIAFRTVVESDVATWEAREPGERLSVQYDPGRDVATSVEVELKG